MAENKLSRAELVSGSLNRTRRAARLLAAIEARCRYMQAESRRVVAAYLLGSGEDFKRRFDLDYLQSLKLAAGTDEVLTLDALERFAPQWIPLAPADLELRARLLQLVGQKYGLGPAGLAALGGDQPEVRGLYHQLFGQFPEELLRAPDAGSSSSPSQPAATREVEARLKWLSLTSGESLFMTGDPGDALYIVISGRLRATIVDEDGEEHAIGEMGRGELIGEMAILTGDRRSASVRAIRDSELVQLGREDFFQLARQHPEIFVRISAASIRRLQQQRAQPGRLNNTLLTFALLPCDPGVPVLNFGHQLQQALQAFGPALVVTRELLEEAIEPGAAQAGLADARNPQIISWLSELESRYRYVVYAAEPEVSEWSQRCLRQADRILLVAQAGASPQPAAHEIELLASEPGGPAGSYGLPRQRTRLPATQWSNRVELILLHDPDTARPAGTARWLAPRSLRGHYHVRSGAAGDMAFLARCLTGHATGLVLAGGGARGFAHIGVCRALEEAGIEIDLVGGTSMGALVTGGVGLGYRWREMRAITAGLASPLKLFDPTLPVVSLFSSGKVTGILQKIYGEARIEDQWRPMFCVSSNLTHSSETVYRQGPVWKAVRASMSIPGIFSPVLHDGDVQVDGAVMNNLPIDIMVDLGIAGTVIGVNVMPLQDLAREYHLGDSLSGTRAALSLLNPYDPVSAPVIYETLVRVMALHEVHQEEAKRRLADIYITPPVEKYNILDFGAYDPIIAIGYQSAREALADWHGSLRTSPAARGTPQNIHQLESALADLEGYLAEFNKG